MSRRFSFRKSVGDIIYVSRLNNLYLWACSDYEWYDSYGRYKRKKKIKKVLLCEGTTIWKIKRKYISFCKDIFDRITLSPFLLLFLLFMVEDWENVFSL